MLLYTYIAQKNQKDPGDTALADVVAPGVMAATYGLVWTLVLADITKGLATNRYHSILNPSICAGSFH